MNKFNNNRFDVTNDSDSSSSSSSSNSIQKTTSTSSLEAYSPSRCELESIESNLPDSDFLPNSSPGSSNASGSTSGRIPTKESMVNDNSGTSHPSNVTNHHRVTSKRNKKNSKSVDPKYFLSKIFRSMFSKQKKNSSNSDNNDQSLIEKNQTPQLKKSPPILGDSFHENTDEKSKPMNIQNLESTLTQLFGVTSLNKIKSSDDVKADDEIKIDNITFLDKEHSVEVPKLSLNNEGTDYRLLKLPNNLCIEKKPFDETCVDEDPEDISDEEELARFIRNDELMAENTIRWREVVDGDGNSRIESNTRLNKWSDGSMSLQIGSKSFEIVKQSVEKSHQLFIRNGMSLHGQALFHSALSFSSNSIKSSNHHKTEMSLPDTSQKSTGKKIIFQISSDFDTDSDDKTEEKKKELNKSLRTKKKLERKENEKNYPKFITPSSDSEDDEKKANRKKSNKKFKIHQASTNLKLFSEDDSS